jgi:hypothetical protein
MGVGEEPNHTTARKLVLYNSLNILCLPTITLWGGGGSGGLNLT